MSLPTDNAQRKRIAMWTYLTEYFPDAFLAEVMVAVIGNEQHNLGQPLHWAREKSPDQMNTAFRHMWDHARGVTKDTDGQYHLAKARWRLGAELQKTIEAERGAAADMTAFLDDIQKVSQAQDVPNGFAPTTYNGMRESDLAEPNFNHTIEMPGIGTGPCRNPRCWCRKTKDPSAV